MTIIATVSARIKAGETAPGSGSRYVDLKPAASGTIGFCPFHDDHQSSPGLNDEGNYWQGFAGCGEVGDQFLDRVEGLQVHDDREGIGGDVLVTPTAFPRCTEF